MLRMKCTYKAERDLSDAVTQFEVGLQEIVQQATPAQGDSTALGFLTTPPQPPQPPQPITINFTTTNPTVGANYVRGKIYRFEEETGAAAEQGQTLPADS